VRWENCVFAFLATGIGFASAGNGHGPWRRAVLAGTVVALVLACGNVVNDLVDEDLDRRSKASRPLPAGRISRRRATRLACWLAGGAVAAVVPLGGVPLVFTIVMLAVGYGYSARLKGIPLVGNLSMAIQVGSTIPFGALCAGRPTATTAIGFLLLMLYSLSLEVAKTVEDQDADRDAGLTTVAHVVARSNQGALVLALTVLCGSSAAALGLLVGAPPGYWLVLAPLVPLAGLSLRWHMYPPPIPAPVTGLLRTSKALWCLALLGLTMVA